MNPRDALNGLASGVLSEGEPAPVAHENPNGTSPAVVVCEHGGRRIPARLGSLGLAEEHLAKHFMWDIGALDLARAIATRLNAPLIHQPYSRMVCDGNRPTTAPDFIPEHGEGIPVPGNVDLSPEEVAARTAAIWQPYQDHIASVLEARAAASTPTVFVSIHSFTPVFYGTPRPWHVGVLYDRDPVLSPALFDGLARTLGERVVGRNEPYVMSRTSDYTVPVHGEDRGLPSVEIEVRNDLIRDPTGVDQWAGVLTPALIQAARAVGIALEDVTITREGPL
ncbi:N-formylglutamate amidohydrolase [Roseospira marina]|uniref:N-formylglutamate amidohydrolase n=1 Tax=Roseospira marina TaxID=140057 RepID=UPI00147910D8|nr:N-formylglutamate amidohydrolase [Roseospira marina]MBB4314281.1 putative N-formylglutamate amidohydrolase [Roseospira marina]MBB5087441.1 putative N-formylglutamate amidohydrolase [Roseospira marina]